MDVNDANHPSRKKAIRILEAIAEMLGQPEIFDCSNGDSRWFDFEDSVTEIIGGEKC